MTITEVLTPNNIYAILDELMPVLPNRLPKPIIKIINHQRITYLGQCTWKVLYFHYNQTLDMPETTTIAIQKAILGDENTLKRVLAHELCHHADDLINNKNYLEKNGFFAFKRRAKMYGSMLSHGPNWQAFANLFNEKYGLNFVTEKSDTLSYIISDLEKPYYVLMAKTSDRNLFQHSIRLTPQQLGFINRLTMPWRLKTTRDRSFMGRRIHDKSGKWTYCLPNTEMEHKWMKLWDSPEIIDYGPKG